MQQSRDKKIIRTSVLGILVNVMLVIFKGLVGFFANSVAVIMDAVNNLSDALSSVITIVGTKLSTKKPDKKHPYGHGRIEYLTSVVIAVIVLIAGVTSLYQSVLKIITPEETSYEVYSYVIISVAIAVKLLFGTYVKKTGKKLNSQTLVASGTDAFFDAVLSLGTLIGAILVMTTGILVFEGILGAIISLFILRSGFEILSETLSSIIGVRADKQLTDGLKETISSFEEVRGVYDMTLHNYGPTKTIGSVHIEVDDDMTAKKIHKLSREISATVYEKFGVILTVGIYSSSASSPAQTNLKNDVLRIISDYPEVLQMHAFYLDEQAKTVSFDLIISFDADAESVKNDILSKVSDLYPEYRFIIVLDTDFSD